MNTTTMNRDSFLGRAKLRQTKTITLGDGQVARIQKLSQSDVEQCRRAYAKDDKAAEGYRYVVVQSLVDEEGKRILEDSDMRTLAEMEFETIQHIAQEVLKFSGVMKDTEKESVPSAE